MTKDELKQMIDSTIATNGKGEITGEALNLALKAIVDAMGSGSTEVVKVPGGDIALTPAELAANAETYERIYGTLSAGLGVSVLMVATGGDTAGQYMVPMGMMLSEGAVVLMSFSGTVTLASDGSVTTA